MSHNPPKPNDVVVIDGDDISHLSPIMGGGCEEITGYRVILKPRISQEVCKGLRISSKEAMKMILAGMRGKRFEAVKAIKWHYVGRETKQGRTTNKTYTNEKQMTEALADEIVGRMTEDEEEE